MKKTIRKSALLRRSGIPSEERALKSRQIAERVMNLPETFKATVVSVYVDFKSEVETRDLIQRLLDAGKTVTLPVVNNEAWELEFVAIDSLNCLVQTERKIWEPARGSGKPISIQEIDLILAPGAAFDRQGNRLGYGGGFYDRVLSRRRADTAVFGMAFAEQVIENVPTDSGDQKVDGIITDIGIIRIEQ